MNRLLKRILIVVGAVIVVIVVALGALFGPAFLGMKPIPEDFEVNGVHLAADGFTTAWVIPTGENQAILIDAGIDATGSAILEKLSELGLGPEAVTAVFLTHGHGDHIAAAPLFQNAEVMALAAEADLVAGRAPLDSPLGALMPTSPTGIEVTRPLRDGEIVRIGQTEVRVYSVPGHTAGSAGYVVNGVLFLGDAGNIADDDTVKDAVWIFSTDAAQSRESLTQLAERLTAEGVAVDAIAFSHSGPLVQGIAPLLALTESGQE